MTLDTLSIINFKNIRDEKLVLSPGINCFVGDNGAGKTNILDAIHYLALAKSMYTITDAQSITHGEEFFMVDGSFRNDDERLTQVVCSYARRTGKMLKYNGKEYDKLSEHVGRVPIVMVSPAVISSGITISLKLLPKKPLLTRSVAEGSPVAVSVSCQYV